jgi:hypothetical protein
MANIFENQLTSHADLVNQNCGAQNKWDCFLGVSFIAIFLSIYIYLMLYGNDFVGVDMSQLTLYSLRGTPYPMPAWPGEGRYWPLGLQEYNLISIFSKTPLAYYLFSVLQLLILVPVIYRILPGFKASYKFLATVLMLTTPSIVISYFTLIIPERNLVFWLAIFVLCVQEFELGKPNSKIFFCGALVSAQFLLYYKEPMFLLISVFAISRLTIKLYTNNRFHWSRWRELIKSNYLEISLVILSTVFIISFLLITLGRVEKSYAEVREAYSEWSTFLSYISLNPLLLVFILLVLLRCFYLILSHKIPNLLFDPLAFSGTIYFLAFVKLKLVGQYYPAPVDFIAIMYLANLVYQGIKITPKARYLPLLITIALIVFNINQFSAIILNQKKITEANVQITEFLGHYIHSNEGKNLVNLFSYNSGYTLHQFSAYLYYKGMNVSSDKDSELYHYNDAYLKKTRITINSNSRYLNDMCGNLHTLKCYYSNETNADLIIILPELAKEPILPDINKEYALLFCYQPKYENIEKILHFFAKKVGFSDSYYNAYIFKKI